MKYTEAKRIADGVVDLLQPHCTRIEIAGSIRRQKAEPNDIEIVAIAKPYEVGLFENGIASVVNKWQKVKGELAYPTCKYTQRILPEGIKLDLFFAEPGNWGNILLLRTGDFEFSKKFVSKILPERGYKHIDGYITKEGIKIDIDNEEYLFDLLKLKFIEPKNRNISAL